MFNSSTSCTLQIQILDLSHVRKHFVDLSNKLKTETDFENCIYTMCLFDFGKMISLTCCTERDRCCWTFASAVWTEQKLVIQNSLCVEHCLALTHKQISQNILAFFVPEKEYCSFRIQSYSKYQEDFHKHETIMWSYSDKPAGKRKENTICHLKMCTLALLFSSLRSLPFAPNDPKSNFKKPWELIYGSSLSS